jgi:hypothetical protein
MNMSKDALNEMEKFFLNSDSEQLEKIYRWARAVRGTLGGVFRCAVACSRQRAVVGAVTASYWWPRQPQSILRVRG